MSNTRCANEKYKRQLEDNKSKSIPWSNNTQYQLQCNANVTKFDKVSQLQE